MKQLLLQPIDVLFFRDGRPMMGASPGRGARLPMQHVVNGALHAALHRAFPDQGGLPGEHLHATISGQDRQRRDRIERFGSLFSTGPFPVCQSSGEWFFPRPLDLGRETTGVSMQPRIPKPAPNSGNRLLQANVVNNHPPTKEVPSPWLSQKGWQSYLNAEIDDSAGLFAGNEKFYDVENAVGIGIDDTKGTTSEGLLYSAEYMRLRDTARLGILAGMPLKGQDADGLDELFPEEHAIAVGGQMRLCRVEKSDPRVLNLPRSPKISGTRVKWVLLTPAIFQPLNGTNNHPGGWLPTWIHPSTGEIQLMDGPGPGKAGRMGVEPGQPIRARLVTARIGNPEPVTGWKNHHREGRGQGSKSTLRAVPAGSVYYFEAEDPEQAEKLSNALSWHGSGDGSMILNRRSGLMGEKGYGIGACAQWEPYKSNR